MNLQIFAIGFVSTMVLVQPNLGHAQAGPKWFGNISVGAVQDEQDFESEAFELELGVKGAYQLDGYKASYQLIIDAAQTANGTSATDNNGTGEINVKQASVVFPSKHGTFVIAPRGVSGNFRNIYGGMRKFEYNEPHSLTPASGGKLFEQPDTARNILAYASPKMNGYQVIAATLQINENNDEDMDIISVRGLYWGDRWHVGISRVAVAKEVGPPTATDDYERIAVGFAYNRIKNVELGGVYEINSDRFGGDDSNVLGLAAKFKFGDRWSVALGYTAKDYDVSTSTDESLTILNLKKQLDKNVAAWVEMGMYDEGEDNIAAGVNVKF